MVIVPQRMVGLRRMSDYRGVGLQVSLYMRVALFVQEEVLYNCAHYV